MPNEKCRLCGGVDTLKQSHIVPKFVYRWMTKTGGQYFRDVSNIKRREQDGFKIEMLCEDCENRFSIYEKYFKENIFQPYILNDINTFEYDYRLYYFCLSVHWRALVYYIEKNCIKNKELDNIEENWRFFLLNIDDIQYPIYDIHLFLSGSVEDSEKAATRNLYFMRAVHIDLDYKQKDKYTYWKFARFLSVCGIADFNGKGTYISPHGGVLKVPQTIDDERVGSLIMKALSQVDPKNVKDKVYLSEKQQQLYYDMISKNPEEFFSTDLGKIILKYVEEGILND